MMGLSWDEVDGVMRRGVERGLARRQVEVPERLGVDETSFQKRHEYVTAVNDLEGRVLHVSDGHGKEALREFYGQFEREERSVWPAWFGSTWKESSLRWSSG